MGMVSGSQILARALRMQGVDTMFYLMGGPMIEAEACCIKEGVRSIDVRHEQAAAMMAHAWARVTNRIGACMAASGPGSANLVTGVANAWADASPLLAIGGAALFADEGMWRLDQLPVKAIQEKYLGIASGRIPDSYGWLTPVPSPAVASR